MTARNGPAASCRRPASRMKTQVYALDKARHMSVSVYRRKSFRVSAFDLPPRRPVRNPNVPVRIKTATGSAIMEFRPFSHLPFREARAFAEV